MAVTVQDLRKRFPDFKEYDDTTFAKAVHSVMFSDVPWDEFSNEIGLGATPQQSGAMRTMENIGLVYPVVETGLNLATIPYGMALSGLAGLQELASTHDIHKAQETLDRVAKILVYQPQTKRGQELTRATMLPFEMLSKAGGIAQEKLEEEGHPVAGALVKTAIEAAPIFAGVGVRGMKAIKSRPTTIKSLGKEVREAPALNESTASAESLFIQEQFRKRFLEEEPFQEAAPLAESTTIYGGIPFHKSGSAWVKHVGEPVWDGLVMKKIPSLLEKNPVGRAINRAVMYEYRGNLPETKKYISSLEEMKRSQALGREAGIDLGNRLSAMSEQSQLKMGEFIRGENIKLADAEMALATEAKDMMYELGKQAVQTGLLDEMTFFKNAGRYMPRLYTQKEYQTKLNNFGLKSPTRLDLSRFRARKDIPKEIREQMGEILTPGYPIAKGVSQLTHDISTARFFNGILANQEWALPRNTQLKIPEGWKKLPNDAKLGNLRGSYVHPEIFADIKQTIKIRGTAERHWREALGAWKYGKVIISPKTHARNLMSNSVLAHLGGLPMWEQPKYLTMAASEMRGKGPLWREIKEQSGWTDTFTTGELKALFDKVDFHMEGVSAESLPGKFGLIDSMWEKSKRGAYKAADLYQAEEMWFKTAKYLHNKKKGMSPQEAWADAEKWLFNYSKLTRFQETYRSGPLGAPFATFTFKALPRIAEATIKYPWRLATPFAIVKALETASTKIIGDTPDVLEAKKQLRPEYMQGSYLGIPNFARVPVVDDEGIGGQKREYYLNLTYIMPWGDLGESGGWYGIPGGVMPFSQPFVREPIEQLSNYDWFWKKPIVEETDVAGKGPVGTFVSGAGKRLEHAARTMLPTPVTDVTKALDAILMKPDYMGRFRSPLAVAADTIAGIKMYPVDYEEQMARFIGTTSPSKGYLARKLMHDIRTLAIQKQAALERGKTTDHYDRQIKAKTKQLEGLAKETKERSGIYKRIINSRKER